MDIVMLADIIIKKKRRPESKFRTAIFVFKHVDALCGHPDGRFPK